MERIKHNTKEIKSTTEEKISLTIITLALIAGIAAGSDGITTGVTKLNHPDISQEARGKAQQREKRDIQALGYAVFFLSSASIGLKARQIHNSTLL